MNLNFDVWQCPKCGYLIPDHVLQAVRFDYFCPRCGTPLGEFIPIPAAQDQDTIDSFQSQS